MDKKGVGKRLEKRKDELGWEDKEAGIRAGISQQYVGQLERGKIPAPWETLFRICAGYACSADWVLGLPDALEPPKQEPLPEGAQELIDYLSSMSSRGREQLLKIAKVVYEDDQDWQDDQQLRKSLRLLLGETAFARFISELPAMLTESSSPDAAVSRFFDTLRENPDSKSGQ